MKKPRTPLDAASMAAYSRRRVESEVQYWIVGGGGWGIVVGWLEEGVLVVFGGEASVRAGN